MDTYTVNKVRYFTNHRDMIGFSLNIYLGKKRIGTANHDGNSMTYNVDIPNKQYREDFIIYANAQDTEDQELALTDTIEALLNQYEEEHLNQ